MERCTGASPGVDEDRNQGDWSAMQVIRLMPKLRMSVFGVLRFKHMGRATATVLTNKGQPLYHAVMRVSGPGIKACNVKTNKRGIATFKLKPRKRGKPTFRATKAGFQPAYGTLQVK